MSRKNKPRVEVCYVLLFSVRIKTTTRTFARDVRRLLSQLVTILSPVFVFAMFTEKHHIGDDLNKPGGQATSKDQ